MNFEKSEQLDLRQYLWVIRKRKTLFILPFLGVIFTVMLGSFFIDPVYQSSTTILVGDPRLLPRSVEKMASGGSSQEHIITMKREITSRDYLRRLIKTIGLDTDPRLRARAEREKEKFTDLTVDEIIERWLIRSLRRKIGVEGRGTDLLTIFAQDKDPQTALLLAKTLAQVFVDETLRRELSGVRGALEFSNEQLAIYKEQLEESEEKLRRFRERMILYSLKLDVKDQKNLDRISSLASSAEADLRQAEDEVTSLTIRLQSLSAGEPLSISDAQVEDMKDEYYDLAHQLAGQLIKYTWRDARVMALTDEINELRGEIEARMGENCRATTSNEHPVYCELLQDLELAKADVLFYRNKWETLSDYMDNYERSLVRGPQEELTLERLKEEVASNRRLYQMFLDQSQAAQIQEAAHRTLAEGKFRIMEPAMLPLKPVEPNRSKLAALGCIIGALVGFTLVFVVEYLDHSLTTVEDVERYLGIPVLGTIPRMDITGAKRGGKKTRLAICVILGMLLAVLMAIFIKQHLMGT